MHNRTALSLILATLVAFVALPAGSATAGPQAPAAPPPAPAAGGCDAASAKKIKALNFDAMDENDKWELEKARQKLEDAKLVAQSRRCETHPELAVTYVLLGVVDERERKTDAMKADFTKALQIDPKVEIPARVQSAKVMRLFAMVKATVSVEAPSERPRPGDARPSGPPTGFEHLPLVKWEEGATMTVTARAAEDLGVAKVTIFFKAEAATQGHRRDLTKSSDDKWTWTVTIPGTDVRGRQFSYFLVAYAAGDKEVAASGNSANMHMVTLTSAASGPRARFTGVENPLDPTERPVGTRRVASGPDPALEDPDAVGPRRDATPSGTVRRRRRPTRETPPMFFASLGLGTGIGLMTGRTEVTGEALKDQEASLGAFYGQLEIGYLITQSFSLNAFARIGYLAISKEVKDGINDVGPQGNDKDMIFLLRARYQSPRLLKASLPVNLRWFAGGGLGWGILRHLVNARHPVDGSKVIDTDLSRGFVPNVFGGVSLCLVKSCHVNLQFEVDYLATFTLDTNKNTPFHLDFTLGANFAF